MWQEAWRALCAGGERSEGREQTAHTAQLIDAASGHHVWAERYDRDLNDIFAVQDEITERIVTSVGPEFLSAEMQRASARICIA